MARSLLEPRLKRSLPRNFGVVDLGCTEQRESIRIASRHQAADQTASSLPLGSVKWKRRPPGNAYGSFRIFPPAALTALTLLSRSSEYRMTSGPVVRASFVCDRPPTSPPP